MTTALLLATMAPVAVALDITETTHVNYQEYLKTIGAVRDGAFAVSPDGEYSYYIYCTDVNCGGIAQEALKKCQSLSGKACSLMAFGREVKIPFTVVSQFTSPSEEIMTSVLTADQLKQLMVGNTLRGEYLNSKAWAEYYDPSGEIRGKDDEKGAYKAAYTLKDDAICFDYPGQGDDWCAKVSMRGNRIDFLKDGKVVNFIRNTVLENGNARGL